MEWVWAVGAAWLLLGVGLALLIGRSIVHADRKAAQHAADEPNFVVDRPPLTLLPQPPDPTGSDATPPSSGAEPRRPRGVPRETPTVPGIPSARPSVGRPPVPRSTRQRPRKTDFG